MSNFDEVMKFFGAINEKEVDAMRRASKEFRKGFVVRDINQKTRSRIG